MSLPHHQGLNINLRSDDAHMAAPARPTLSVYSQSWGTKASGNDHREHTGLFLTCVPGAGLPTGCALQDALQGWPMQGVHFGSAAAHGVSFSMPAGAVLTNWLTCGQAVGTGGASWQVSAMICFILVCQIPRNTMAWQMEHPTGLLVACSGKALFVLKRPVREKITSYSKERLLL